MRWVLLLFLVVSALLHLYPLLRFLLPNIKSLFLKGLVVGLFGMGFISPFLWRYADMHWSPQLTYIIAFSGLLWIGFVFYLFVLSLLLELYTGFTLLSKRLLHINPLPRPSGRSASVMLLLLSLSLSAYSHYETLQLHVERFTIYTDKLPEGVDRLRILHLSDVHLGPVMGIDKIELIRQVYHRERPHLVVSTGDLVDGNMKNKTYLAQALADINPPLGKYAVLGNHEYYRGVEQAIDFTHRAGFRLLRGESVELREYNLTLAGIEDSDCKFFHKCTGTLSDRELLEALDRRSFVIYLKHKPRLEEGAYGLFDLMLSGHTHGGVYYPVGKLVLTRMFISDRGLHHISGSYVYISKGVGTGGPPMRLFSPPDVAIIDLVNRRR